MSMAPLFAPSAQSGVLDDLHNEIATGTMFKITEKPNGQGGGEDGDSWRRFESKRHWKPWEDVKLRGLVALHGPRNWNIISEQLPGRSGKSCRLRWVNQLDPKIKKTRFSKEEDDMLMAAHSVFGNQWSQIAKFLPGRTDNGIKNHWHVLTGRRNRNVAGVCRRSSSSSSGSFQLPASGDSTNGSSGSSTITVMGKSPVTSEGTSLPCMSTLSSVVREEEIKMGLAAPADGGHGGYLKSAMEISRGHMTEAAGTIFIPSKSRLFVYNSLENSTTNSNTATSDFTAISWAPPKFIDFLGVEE